jgi:alginate O-acetyltransferase complex protein AlgI
VYITFKFSASSTNSGFNTRNSALLFLPVIPPDFLMVFSTVSFLFVFLPAFLLSYAVLPWKNLTALAFSLLFFSWGEGTYLALLLGSIGLNYFVGLSLGEKFRYRRLALALGIAANLTILGYYEYFGFLLAEVFSLSAPANEIPHLPLGISFFTFQAMSYLIDVYRGDTPRARSFFDLALYIAMFPQLIAGPIVRYSTVALALRERRVTSYDIYRGGFLFVIGLSYKTLIANNCAIVADAAFAKVAVGLASSEAWLGIIAYSLQIFFDFAGYSLMAIGLGRIMGFHFPSNFNYPYISKSITEFWRRWHISLSSWFRDYLYIPLGGNRHGAMRTYLNLFLVFFLCGLWHGAAWTFIVWGVFHGVILALERMGLRNWINRLPSTLQYSYTLLLVMLGWVLFRAETMDEAVSYLMAMFNPGNQNVAELALFINHESMFFLGVGIIFSLPLLESSIHLRTQADSPRATQAASWRIYRDGAIGLALFLLCTTYIMSGTYSPFIYFRF